MSTDERNLEAHITRALQELLAGREPHQEDTSILTGDAKACIEAMMQALHTDGVQAVRKAFTALMKDRPWLGKLASQALDDQEQKPTRRIRFLPTADFLNRIPQQWLIPGILPKDGIAMVFGLSGTYKSFLTMAWSLCIGTGIPWLGRPVMRGYVAYICAEGSYGIGKRVKAWMTHHAYTHVERIAVKWFDETMILQDAAHLQELLTALEEDFPEPPVMVVIDTLSRCSAGADENSNTEMANLIACADAIRQRLHCTVLIVHHAGKDTQRGPRGASALFGNTETLIAVTPTTVGCTVSSVKPKDAPKFEDIHLTTHVVSYGPLEDDSSLVLILGDAKDAKPALSKSESVMYAALQGKQLSFSDWVRVGMGGEAKVISKTSAENAIKALVRMGYVQKVGNLYSPASPQEQEVPESFEE